MVKVEPTPGFALDANVAAHHLAELFRERQAQAGAAIAARGGIIGLRESAKQFSDLLGRHADAGVLHAEDEPIRPVARLAAGGEGDDAVVGELAGVAQQVQQALPHLDAVGLHGADVGGAFDDELVVFSLQQGAHDVFKVADHRRDFEGFQMDFHLAGFDFGDVEDVVDEFEQVFARVVDAAQVFGPFLALLGLDFGESAFR